MSIRVSWKLICFSSPAKLFWKTLVTLVARETHFPSSSDFLQIICFSCLLICLCSSQCQRFSWSAGALAARPKLHQTRRSNGHSHLQSVHRPHFEFPNFECVRCMMFYSIPEKIAPNSRQGAPKPGPGATRSEPSAPDTTLLARQTCDLFLEFQKPSTRQCTKAGQSKFGAPLYRSQFGGDCRFEKSK